MTGGIVAVPWLYQVKSPYAWREVASVPPIAALGKKRIHGE